jgi:hypothetical protein
MASAILSFGVVTAVVAGAAAYLITLHEMRRHYASAGPPRREALRSAVVTAVFFLILACVLAIAVPSMLTGGSS